jgi:hypothetical protein
MGLGDTGTAPDLANAGTTNAYNFGKAVATRYAGYPNIVWHVMGDFGRVKIITASRRYAQ